MTKKTKPKEALYPLDKGQVLERITWLDHSSMIGKIWYDRDEVEKNKEPSKMRSVGFVVGENADTVIMSLSCSADGQTIQQPFYCLKSNILKREKLRW